MRTIGIDLDGTLIDSMPDLESIAVQLFERRYGWDFFRGRELYRTTAGVPFAQQVYEINPGHEANEDVITSFEMTKERLYERVRAFGYAREVLEKMWKLDWRPVLISATPHALSGPLVRRLDLPIDIDVGVSSKHRQLKRQGAVAFIGDTRRDAQEAQRAGVVFLGVRGIFPDMPYTSLADVAESALGIEL